MKALSIMQPWAWLIVNGHKDIENRTWWTRFRGPVLIHAGKKYDDDFDCSYFESLDRVEHAPWTGDIDAERGGIVGECEIVDCVQRSDSEWFSGPYGFVIRNARPLPFRPCRGMLGFFEPDFSPPAPKPPKPAKVTPPSPQSVLDL